MLQNDNLASHLFLVHPEKDSFDLIKILVKTLLYELHLFHNGPRAIEYGLERVVIVEGALDDIPNGIAHRQWDLLRRVHRVCRLWRWPTASSEG